MKLKDRPLISINGSKFFATSDHTFKSKSGWVSADPELTKKNYQEVIEHIGQTPTAIKKGTILLTIDGEQEVQSLNFEDHDPETEVYDISLTGNKTFYADNYLVHNGGCGADPGEVCFFAGTKILMADGKTKNIETIKVGDVTAFGLVHQKYARRYDYSVQVSRRNGCMEYDGIYVTGFHVVMDGDKWIPSYESTKSNPCLPPDNQEQAYNLVTEKRIIPVMGNHGLHYFADELNNRDGICEKSLLEHMKDMQEIA